MTSQLETDLRDAMAQRAATIPARSHVRLNELDYRPRVRSPWPRVAVGGLGVAAASAVALVTAAGPGTSNAFAGWTSSPTTPTGAGAIGEAACTAGFAPHPPPASAPLMLTDVRGPFTLAPIEASPTMTVYCFEGPSFAGSFVTLTGSPRTTLAPGTIETGVVDGALRSG